MKKTILISVIMVLCLVGSISALTVTRTLPSSTNANFQVTYQASSLPTGVWAILIHDYVNGGCKYPDGTNEYKAFFTSSDGATSQSVIVTSPSSGTCTFITDGVYGQGTTLTNFPSQSITIGNGQTNPTNPTIPKLDLGFLTQVVTNIGGFDILWWHIIALIVGVIIIVISK